MPIQCPRPKWACVIADAQRLSRRPRKAPMAPPTRSSSASPACSPTSFPAPAVTLQGPERVLILAHRANLDVAAQAFGVRSALPASSSTAMPCQCSRCPQAERILLAPRGLGAAATSRPVTATGAPLKSALVPTFWAPVPEPKPSGSQASPGQQAWAPASTPETASNAAKLTNQRALSAPPALRVRAIGRRTPPQELGAARHASLQEVARPP